MARLGVNIDHVATLRQARREGFPNVAQAALAAERAGADSITVHLREDRRHIQDADIPAIQKISGIPLNLEMALHPDIVKFVFARKPEKVCLVPEKRAELTTEGGINLLPLRAKLAGLMPKFIEKKIRVSCFIDADPEQIETAARLGAAAIEIHTGRYAQVSGAARKKELQRIQRAARLASGLGLEVHAGHGLDYENVKYIRQIREIEEMNIGFAIIARAVFTGLPAAVADMKRLIK